MRPDAAMIFCAGFGTRMGVLTADTPKPLLQVEGTTLFDRVHHLARDAGLSKIVINTHYLAEAMEAHVADEAVTVSREVPDILDTGGGLKAALPLFGDDPIFTANPDVIWAGPNPFRVAAMAWANDADALLLCIPAERAIGRADGDFHQTAEGGLGRIGPLVYGGLQIIRPAVVARIQDTRFSLNRVWNDLIATNRIRCATYPGWWCDVGTPEGIERAARLIAEKGVD